jgi:hypothetical protein
MSMYINYINNMPHFVGTILSTGKNLNVIDKTKKNEQTLSTTETTDLKCIEIANIKNIKLNELVITKRIQCLQDKATQIRVLSGFKSNLYKYLSLLFNLGIIILGSLITLFSSLNYISTCESNYNVLLISFGITVSTSKALQVLFSFDKKCIEFKKIHIISKKILWKLEEIEVKNFDADTFKSISDDLEALDLGIFLDGLQDT